MTKLAVLFSLFLVFQLRAQDYLALKQKIENLHEKLSKEYELGDAFGKDSLLKNTQNLLFDILHSEIFPAWYGTKWDYNGTSEIPKEGKIACGYFVTTTLRDLGFDFNRYQLAQLPSESMILKLTSKVKRFSNTENEEVWNYFTQFSTGIFIVGLDSHAGFILKTKDSIKFIHSVLYQDIDGVSAQDLKSENLFNLSSYKIIGEILTDEMLIKWLKNEKFE